MKLNKSNFTIYSFNTMSISLAPCYLKIFYLLPFLLSSLNCKLAEGGHMNGYSLNLLPLARHWANAQGVTKAQKQQAESGCLGPPFTLCTWEKHGSRLQAACLPPTCQAIWLWALQGQACPGKPSFIPMPAHVLAPESAWCSLAGWAPTMGIGNYSPPWRFILKIYLVTSKQIVPILSVWFS